MSVTMGSPRLDAQSGRQLRRAVSIKGPWLTCGRETYRVVCSPIVLAEAVV